MAVILLLVVGVIQVGVVVLVVFGFDLEVGGADAAGLGFYEDLDLAFGGFKLGFAAFERLIPSSKRRTDSSRVSSPRSRRSTTDSRAVSFSSNVAI